MTQTEAKKRENGSQINNEICEKRFERSNELPVDTGHAWVICGATFFITFLMITYDQTLAVVLPDLMEKYETSVAKTSLVFMINNLCFGIGSVLSSSVAVPRTDERVVILACTTLNAVMSIILSLSPNIVFFHLMHIVKGVCLGSMWVPALGLVEHYFKRYRSFATALCSSGIAFSMLVSTQMIRRLTDYYGLSGAYLMLSALEMHGVAAALLMRPVSAYHRVIHDRKAYALSGNNSLVVEPPEEEVSFITTSTSMATSKSMNSTCTTETAISPASTDKIKANVRDRGTSEIASDAGADLFDPDFLSTLKGTSCIAEDDEGAQFKQLLSEEENKGNLCSMQLVEAGLSSELGAVSDEGSGRQINNHRFCCGLVESRLWSNWLFPLLLVSAVHGALMMFTSAYLPTIALAQGLDKAKGTLLLTIAGAINFIGMPLQGFILDYTKISPSQYVALAQIVIGTVCHLIRFLTSFPALVVISVTQGLLGGSRISLVPVVAVEFVDVQSAGKVVGFNAFVGTISLALHHPLLGYIRDITGSFNISFHYVGCGLYLSAVLLLLSPLVRKTQQTRRRQRQKAS